MATEPKPASRSLWSRIAAAAIGALALVAASAFFLPREEDSPGSDEAAFVPVQEQGDRVVAGPAVQAIGATSYASALVAGHAHELSRRELAASLAAATDDGRSPIAVVERRTALRSAPDGRVLERLGTETEFGSPRVHAVVGHDGDWLEVLAAELPNGRTGWIAADDVEVGGSDYSLHASVDERVIDVRQRGRVVRQIEVGVGGPTTPTPTGTYAVTDKLRITDSGSPYGCCALALTGHQPDIPQGWSGGDRLALHATPDESTVGLASSLGCFRARGDDMEWLLERVPLGAPVIVSRAGG